MTVVDEAILPDGEGPAEATPEFEAAAARADRRRGFTLALPAYAYLIVFFAVPVLIVLTYSFASRTPGGTELANWNLDSYQKLGEPVVREILRRSVGLALLTTLICLLFGYPFAYFMATRSATVRNLMLVFVMIPFWSNFLVRNYAWRVILGPDGPWANATDALSKTPIGLVPGSDGLEVITGESIGIESQELLFTQPAVVLGLVYGFLPFMILPLYASIERIDLSLVEASRDLYASGYQTFRRVLLPLSMPGVIAGSILVFVPSLGAYVTPEILGGAKSTLLGSYIVIQFLTGRNAPFGAALSTVLMAVMLVGTLVYFRSGGRNL